MEYMLENLPDYAAQTHYGLPGAQATVWTKLVPIPMPRASAAGARRKPKSARLAAFQLPPDRIDAFRHLSGGQKRFVELVKVTLSDADLALIDEPTNHMDYVAKQTFIDWLKNAKQSVVVVTHDRDVLAHVDRIVEIKSRSVDNFPGNYDAYLKQNGAATAKAIDSYENAQKRIIKLDKQIREAKAKKGGWSGTADKTNPFMLLEKRLTKERDELAATMTKPDFWIDQETLPASKTQWSPSTTRTKRVTSACAPAENTGLASDSP
jgi:ATPase subunit of ABC transporter with duplicated ATPase domains